MPAPVVEAVQAHLRAEVEMGGYEAADAARQQIESTYESVARLVGGEAGEIAVVENATVAFAQALSTFDFRPGETIVTSRNDYISNQLMFLSLAERQGVRIVRAGDATEGGIDPDSLRRCIRRERPRLVALTWVPTNSGLVQPAETVGDVCAEQEVPYLLDACQVVGQMPIDVRRLRCHYLCATARKFLRGPRGVGFLWVASEMLKQGRAPLYLDMRGADWVEPDAYAMRPDAKRFENWEFAYALHIGLGEAARYALRVGVEAGGAHAIALAGLARERLGALPGVRVLDQGREPCAIVTAEVGDVPANEIVSRLREQAINTSATYLEWAQLDMRDKHARTAIRISPHYYNTASEIVTAVGAIEEFTGPW